MSGVGQELTGSKAGELNSPRTGKLRARPLREWVNQVSHLQEEIIRDESAWHENIVMRDS